MSEKRKELVAYHEAGHALVGALMPDYDAIQKVTIIPRGRAGGLTWFLPTEERMQSRAYLQNQMAVALGGRIAEEIVFGDEEVTTGASSDLQQVASTARQMVMRFGMSDKLGLLLLVVPMAICSLVVTLLLSVTSLKKLLQLSMKKLVF